MQKLNLFIVMILCIACSSSKKVTETLDSPMADFSDNTVITKSFPLKNAEKLNANFVGTIHYTQGKHYKCSASGKAQFINQLEIYEEGNTLYIKDQSKSKQKAKIDIYITTPTLNALYSNGVSDFKAEMPLTLKDITIDNNGVGSVDISEVTCQTAHINTRGVGSLTMNFKKANSLNANISGVGNFTCKANANTVTVKNSGVGNVKLDTKSAHTSVSNSGVGNLSLSVDCNNLEVINSSVGSITVSGTADKVSIKGGGVSRIKTSKLNKGE